MAVYKQPKSKYRWYKFTWQRVGILLGIPAN
jgi:hypothetical protein